MRAWGWRDPAAALCRVAVACVVVASVVVSAAATSGAAPAWGPPVFDRIISGPSKPAIGAWGLAYNAHTDEFVVGDYVSNQVRRYSRAGEYVADFINPMSTTDSIISAVAVDPTDGFVYAAATSLTTEFDIRKYDPSGNFLFGFNVPGRVAWLTVDDNGYLWYAPAYGSHLVYKYRVDDASRTATEILHTGTRGTGPGRSRFHNGIDAGATGHIYVADALNQTVHVFNNSGAWVRDIGSSATFDGDLRGVVVDDALGRVYVSDAKGGDVEVFDLVGNHLRTIGEEGDGLGQFGAGARQLAVTPDGHLWAADYAAFRVQEFLPDGTWQSVFPRPAQLPDETGLVGPWALGTDAANGDVLVADHWGQRVQRFSSSGALLDVFGRRARTPEEGTNYPRGVAVDPATRNIWVLNAEGEPYLAVYDREFNPIMQIVTHDLSTGLELVNGQAWVAYRSKGIQVFDMATGALVRQWSMVGSGTYQGLGVDRVSGRMWVPIRDQAQVRVLRSDGTLQWTLTAEDSPTDVAFRGDVAYVTDTGASLVIAYDRNTGARLGTFGSKGERAGQLLGPKGIELGPDGKLYIAEVQNARVQVFSFGTPPAPETNRPTIGWDAPAPGVATAALPLRITGTASDDTAIATVDATILHEGSGRYLNVRDGTWRGTTAVSNQAVFEGDRAAGSWTLPIVPAVYGDRYTVKVKATDVHGNTRYRTESVIVEDTAAPTVAIDDPVPGTTVPAGALAVAATASDDGLLAQVSLALADPATGRWWDPDGGWTSAETWTTLTVDPSVPTVEWTESFDLGQLAGTGPYRLHAKAVDARGNSGLAAPVPISVGPDTTAPETAITTPTQDEQLPAPPRLTGTATDAVGVTAVDVALMDRATGLWWRADAAAWGSFRWNPVAVAAPGAPSTTWEWTPPLGDGSYYLKARAADAAGNVEATHPAARFTVASVVADTGAPETVVSDPTTDEVVDAPPLIAGNATDDFAVASVEIAIKDRATGLWWDTSTATWRPFVWNTATLSSPGSASSGWSWRPAIPPGDYFVQARAVDAAGQADPTRASVRFTAS